MKWKLLGMEEPGNLHETSTELFKADSEYNARSALVSRKIKIRATDMVNLTEKNPKET